MVWPTNVGLWGGVVVVVVVVRLQYFVRELSSVMFCDGSAENQSLKFAKCEDRLFWPPL